jgi:hypothetical protein
MMKTTNFTIIKSQLTIQDNVVAILMEDHGSVVSEIGMISQLFAVEDSPDPPSALGTTTDSISSSWGTETCILLVTTAAVVIIILKKNLLFSKINDLYVFIWSWPCAMNGLMDENERLNNTRDNDTTTWLCGRSLAIVNARPNGWLAV